MKPLVSVIVPNYNYSAYVSEAIESALDQSYANIEVIVVDDGSTDDSIRVLEGFGSKIKLIKQANAGVARARNYGVANSSGEYIAFLDADDLWMPDKIDRQVARLIADPEVGLVHVGVTEIDGKGQTVGERIDGMEGDVTKELLLLERSVVLGGGSGFIVRRDLFESVGGFDEKLSTSADWDFFVRVSRLARLGFVPEPLLRYRLHGSNMHQNVKLMESEMLLGYEKVFGTGNADLLGYKRRAFGNFHRMLAGSYFHSREYGKFLKQTVLSLCYRPSNILYFASLPIRRLKR